MSTSNRPITGQVKVKKEFLYTIHIQGTRGNASSFDGNVNFVAAAPPVPEPATWAMMMIGFGVVGWQLRRRTSRRQLIAQAA
ncbi:hypothetical protein GCM10022276_19220 [Sphingomonas limnosediminicola]|uniref:Ice-binding protein C-terminal domain-containing protein n=1 Tax=Sphingomonas limnosediminicola TaxID=940133 RepID=A0ABP7LGD5_9SPHN